MNDDSYVAVTHHDYEWIDSWGNEFFHVAYCLTIVQDLSPPDLLDRLGVEERTCVEGAEQTIQPAYDTWDRYGDGGYVAVTDVDGSALMFEANGFVGITEDVAVPGSRQTRWVSHYRNVNAHSHFYWFENGALRLHFDPLLPIWRDGSEADAHEPLMNEVGFDTQREPGNGPVPLHHTAAAFALAERLTGATVTPSLLSASEYLCGIVGLANRRADRRPRPPDTPQRAEG